tara:strand:- start:344 stop:1372 length:1029 start_codon:yes stop_codon:yes gene_type:complete
MNFKNRITRFLKQNIKWKLKAISNLIKINLYPQNFNFLKINFNYFYSKFIFNLIFYEKVFWSKKFLKNKIFIQQKNLSKKLKCFVSSPGSGGTFVRNVFNSYFEIRFGIGNGIPKFNNITNTWVFSGSPWLSADLYNAIEDKISAKRQNNSEKFYSEKQFFDKAIIFTRYPFRNTEIDLFDFNEMKFLVLFRNPHDWMISQYTKYEIRLKKNNTQINKDFINKYLMDLKKYYIFWNSFKNNNKNILYIDYNNITKNNFKTFKKIFSFFNYDKIDNNLILNCIKYNSVTFSKKLVNNNFKGTRFTDVKKKKKISLKISKFLKYEINRLGMNKLYKELNKKVSV